MKYNVRALPHLSNFELVREAQELRNPFTKAAKGKVRREIVRIKRIPRLGVIELMI